VILGDACAPPLAPGSVALVVTSLPYFGSTRMRTARSPGQLYAAERYDEWLSLLDRAFAAVARALAPGGRTAIFVENVRAPDGAMLPIAWDAGRALGRHLVLRDERVLVYARERAEGSTDPCTTDRAHEYVLVAERRR
jgi:DNA modification methylase